MKKIFFYSSDQLPGQFHYAQEMGGQNDEEQPVLRNESSQLALSTVVIIEIGVYYLLVWCNIL